MENCKDVIQENINYAEKLPATRASTSIDCHNRTDITLTFQNWTCGFVFLVDTKNCPPGETVNLKAEYVWYDIRVLDENNKILVTAKGVYYSKSIYVTCNSKGEYEISYK